MIQTQTQVFVVIGFNIKMKNALKHLMQYKLMIRAKVRYFIAQEIAQSSLITINSLEEQQFVEDLLFNQNKVIDNIWLGARRDYKTGQFEWDMKNRTRLTFTNWDGKLRNQSNYDCAQIISDFEGKGKWINTNCKRRNIIVCQKMQNWGIMGVQIQLLRLQREFQTKVSDLTDSLDNAKTLLKRTQDALEKTQKALESKEDDLQSNSVPIGFIYVQLPDQQEPS